MKKIVFVFIVLLFFIGEEVRGLSTGVQTVQNGDSTSSYYIKDIYDPSPAADDMPGHASGVIVHYESGDTKYDWKILNYWRSTDEYKSMHGDKDYQKDYFVFNDAGIKYLMFYGWSGGNNCCWHAFLFDLNTGKFKGSVLTSEVPIITEERKKCALRVKVALARDSDGAFPFPVTYFCFKDGKFHEEEKQGRGRQRFLH